MNIRDALEIAKEVRATGDAIGIFIGIPLSVILIIVFSAVQIFKKKNSPLTFAEWKWCRYAVERMMKK